MSNHDSTPSLRATALAHPNIAFIKYWGNREDGLRLPVNGSLSMNMDGLETRTSVLFDAFLPADDVRINGKISDGASLGRISSLLNEVRQMAGIDHFARMESESNFPIGVGIASSAVGFAALALAASKAAGLDLGESDLSRLARHGAGSACRSIPGGFVEWQAGTGDVDSYAFSIAPPEHWELADCVAVLSAEHKTVGSTEGHALAKTSPLQAARVADAARRLDLCRKALLERDFSGLAAIVELDSDMMHAVMMTSHPALFYWQPATLTVMQAVREARAKGLPVCYTIDAGPNVHVITERAVEAQVVEFLRGLPGVREVLLTHAGGPARLI